MAKLSPEQIILAKSWLHDIFVAGGLYPTPRRDLPMQDYCYMYGTGYYNTRRRPTTLANAKELCELAFKFRKTDAKTFSRIDELLEYFSTCYFLPSLQATYGEIRRKPDMLAKYISWFCSENEFWWNDEVTSTYEMEVILQTALGKALYSNKCFKSQRAQSPKVTSVKSSSATAASSSGTTGNGGASTQPQNGFKSRGALSGVAVDLLSTPNQKEHLSTPIYCVNGVDANGVVVEDTAYIRPVEADAKSQAKYTVNNTNKVLFGKAKGYGYCQVYFTDKQAADDFCMKLIASNPKVNSNIVLIKVCQLKSVLANGYFKIGTEFGPVYISASKLNECLTEEVQEETPEQPKSGLSNKERWERYEEAFFHEM